MNQVPIKLGPLALLLTIISICLTTLSILTFTTSRADLRLADKYAETVKTRYELEREGQAFLQEAEETVSSGLPLNAVFDAMPVPGGGISRTFEQDGTVLTVTLLPDSEKGYAVSGWTITRQWEEDNSIGNLWMGE
ncbi:MAG: hypothetical protein Q4C02_05120 [Eubacteriales bacterium]|nr:hypothetical protein [Eubacteriales bacterium]